MLSGVSPRSTSNEDENAVFYYTENPETESTIGLIIFALFCDFSLLSKIRVYDRCIENAWTKLYFKLAATLRGSRPGVQSVSPKTPKNPDFWGHPTPRGRTAPIF